MSGGGVTFDKEVFAGYGRQKKKIKFHV